MATSTPISFSSPTSAIPSLPASTRTYKFYNANFARTRIKGSDPDAYVEHTNGIDDNDIPITFPALSTRSLIDPAPPSIQAFALKHIEQREHEENSDDSSTSATSSPLASSPTTSARPSIDAPAAGLSCSEMETLVQALHYKISVDHHQAPLYVTAVECFFIGTIYQGMGERIFADAQYRGGADTDYHTVRRMFMDGFRTYLQSLTHSNMEIKVQNFGDERGQDCKTEDVRWSASKLGHGADEEGRNWHGSVFYDTDEEREIARTSTEIDMPLNDTGVILNSSNPTPDEEKPWYGPGCYDDEEEVQHIYIILEEAWQTCQNADRAISNLTARLTEYANISAGAQDSTHQEIIESVEMVYESKSEALGMLGKKQFVGAKQELIGGDEIIAREAAAEPYGQWPGAADRAMAEGSVETLVLSDGEGVVVRKQELAGGIQESEPEHFAWARAQDGLKAKRKNDAGWGNCVSAWKGLVTEEQMDGSGAEWIGAADMGENDIKDEVEAEMLREEEYYGEGNSALVAQCGLVL